MLGMLSLLLAVSQAAATPPGVEREIVVIGERLRTWRARYSVRGRQVRCRTTRSTGDREIDAIGCVAFEACIGRLRARIDESDRSDLESATRRSLKAAIRRDLAPCLTAHRDELIADLADRRFRARSGE